MWVCGKLLTIVLRNFTNHINLIQRSIDIDADEYINLSCNISTFEDRRRSKHRATFVFLMGERDI
jgi:hypothetical protein